jgi:hypothetical protein
LKIRNWELKIEPKSKKPMQEEKPKKELNLQTPSKITWCPGCPNSAILVAFRQLVSEMVSAGKVLPENIVVGSGIGCHGKITDYLNLNSFTSLHGVILAFLGLRSLYLEFVEERRHEYVFAQSSASVCLQILKRNTCTARDGVNSSCRNQNP